MLDPSTLDPMIVVQYAALAGVMGTAVVLDVKHQWIPNSLTYPAALVGLGLGFLVGGWDGLLSSFLGFLLGFGILFLGFMFGGGVGGGDVKLGGALGAMTGLSTTGFGLMYTGLLAGAMAFAVLIWKGRLLSSLRNIGRFMFTSFVPGLEVEELKEENQEFFPLGVAIVGGFLWALVEQQLGAKPFLDLGF